MPQRKGRPRSTGHACAENLGRVRAQRLFWRLCFGDGFFDRLAGQAQVDVAVEITIVGWLRELADRTVPERFCFSAVLRRAALRVPQSSVLGCGWGVWLTAEPVAAEGFVPVCRGFHFWLRLFLFLILLFLTETFKLVHLFLSFLACGFFELRIRPDLPFSLSAAR
jgi:hypothetical protein